MMILESFHVAGSGQVRNVDRQPANQVANCHTDAQSNRDGTVHRLYPFSNSLTTSPMERAAPLGSCAVEMIV